MNRPKLMGCCTCCDKLVFNVTRRDPDTREPIQLGAPLDDAVRTTFLLASGSMMDLTFCRKCNSALSPEKFYELWKRVLISWITQSGSDHEWVKTQTENGIVGMLHSVDWKDL